MAREEILEAAALIFSQKGYHAASMQDIAGAVHLQKASLYHHFTSKQEILLALLDRGLDVLTARLEEVLTQPLPPAEKLRQAMVSYLGTMAEYQSLSAVLLLEHRSLEAELRARHVPRRDRFERLWRDLIQQGKEAGIYDCPDPSLAGRAILGVLNWSITWYRSDGPSSAEEIAERFADLFLHGLLSRPAETGQDNLPLIPQKADQI
jgi:AcrR family transcriptional regulator